MANVLVDPVRLLLMMSGRVPPVPLGQIDCDDVAAFMLALAFFLDMPAEIVTVAADPSRPEQFTHVYLRLGSRERPRIPYDVTSGPYPGQEPSAVSRRRAWPADALIDPSNYPETDRPTARTVAAMIERAHASASHPEFHSFMRQLARLLVPVLAGMISQEERRRSEQGQEFQRSVGATETHGHALLGNFSGEDLEAFGSWLARCLRELQQEDVDLLKLIECAPKISIPDLDLAQTIEWTSLLVNAVAAWLKNPRPAQANTRQDS